MITKCMCSESNYQQIPDLHNFKLDVAQMREDNRLSPPAQLQCSCSAAREPGNEVIC